MSGETNLAKLISSMKPSLSDERYVFACLQNDQIDYLPYLKPKGTFWEEEGLTVIVSQLLASKYQLRSSGTFQCITLNVHSSLDAVGLTAAISNQLASNNISANVIAAYYHDHVFVNEKDASRALASLEGLSDQ